MHSHGSNSADRVSRRRKTEHVTVYLVCTIESQKCIHACQGKLRVDAAFYASLRFDDIEQFLEGALECENLLDVLILRDQQLPETKTFCKRQC